MNDTENMDEEVFYKNTLAYFVLVIFLLACAIALIYLPYAPEKTLEEVNRSKEAFNYSLGQVFGSIPYFYSVLAMIFLALATNFLFVLLRSYLLNKPALKINKRGIQYDDRFFRTRSIAWSEISSIDIGSYGEYRRLKISNTQSKLTIARLGNLSASVSELRKGLERFAPIGVKVEVL